jgi:hypothetical protein
LVLVLVCQPCALLLGDITEAMMLGSHDIGFTLVVPAIFHEML